MTISPYTNDLYEAHCIAYNAMCGSNRTIIKLDEEEIEKSVRDCIVKNTNMKYVTIDWSHRRFFTVLRLHVEDMNGYVYELTVHHDFVNNIVYFGEPST